ncbi:MAG: hypothetical protein V1746_08495, partial [bacterium]
IPIYKDYYSLIESHYRSSQRIFDYLNAIIKSRRYRLTVRPHPREKLKRYQNWLEQLEPEDRQWVQLDSESNITQLLFNCDLRISCENCTTAMEAWIAKKPTVELVFDRHPVLYAPFFAELQPLCDDPARLVNTIEAQLQNPEQSSYLQGRQRHLQKWCNVPRGTSIQTIANLIADLLKQRPRPDWSHLRWNDFRRGWKLKILQALGIPYHVDPFLPLKKIFLAKKYTMKHGIYQKSIRPADVHRMQALLKKTFEKTI